MENLSSTFAFHGQFVRTAGTPDAPWFVARDVCAVLDLTWSGATLAAIPDHWKGLLKFNTPGGDQDLAVITEAAVYKLAFRSNKASAEAFTNWVAREVLPTIRQTGRYDGPADHDLSDPLVVARLLQDSAARFIESETARREALRQLEIQAPVVAFAQKVELSPVDISIGVFAKMIDWGPNLLHAELRRRGFLFKRRGHPVPKQCHVDAGYFHVRQVPKGKLVFPVTVITGRGQLWLAKQLGVGMQKSLNFVP